MRQLGRTDFDAAFTPGTIFQCPTGGRIHVRQVEIGDLVLPSGEVVACDPSRLGRERDIVPFARTAPPGKYPVILSLMAGEEGVVDQGVACAMVRFTAAKPAAWEMAVHPGQDASALPVGQFFGYGVDAGMGCFIDKNTLQALAEEDAGEFYHERVIGEMYKSGEHRGWTNIVVDQKSGRNLAVFSSGYGDGVYASYWGLGAAGELCCLITDFAILVEDLKGRSTFQISDWIGEAICHPNLSRIGLTVRLLPLDEPQDRWLRVRSPPMERAEGHRLRVQLEGGRCKAVIANGGKEYSSDRLSYTVYGAIGTYDFRFDEPLQPDAQITLEYGMGVQALEPVT
jgi:hypothetical protein